MPIDLTRSVLVILIPGAVAIAPWLLCLVLYTSATIGYAEKYTTLANAVCFAAAAITGLVCETLGTWIEVRWDKKREKEWEIKENWYSYLAHQLSPEPVGYRYLSRLATSFYFELSMLIAMFPFGIGVGLLLWLRFPEARSILGWLVISVLAVLLFYFWFNARTTHKLLCTTRKELNERIAARQPSANAPR